MHSTPVLEYSLKLVTICYLVRGYTVVVHSLKYMYDIDSQHVNTMFSQESLQKATQQVQQYWFPPHELYTNQQPPASSTVAWQRVIKKKGFNNCSNNKNREKKCDPSQKWLLRTFFKCVFMQVLRMREFKSMTIFINVCIDIFIKGNHSSCYGLDPPSQMTSELILIGLSALLVPYPLVL